MNKLSILLIMFYIINSVSAQGTTQCPGFLPSRLVIGQQGRVTPGDPNNVRDAPTSSGERTGQIPGSGVFMILDGPICADGFAWWQVEYDGLIGWTVEGSGETYWLEPTEPTRSVTLSENAISKDDLSRLQPRELDFTDLTDFAWSPDSRWGAFYENDGIWVKDYSTPEIGATLLIRSNQVSGIHREAAGFTYNNLLAYIQGSSVEFVRPDTGDFQFQLRTGYVNDFVISADGRLMVTLDIHNIQLWDIEQQVQRFAWNTEDDNYFRAIAINADNSLLAAAVDTGQVMLWDTHNGSLLRTLHLNDYGNPDEYVYNLAFSPSGSHLAGASGRQVALWDLPTGRKLASLKGRNQVIYSPDGSLLFTVHPYDVPNRAWDQRGDILIYDSQTGIHLATLDVSANYSSGNLIFKPDGTAFYSVSVFSPTIGENTPLEWTIDDGSSAIVKLIDRPGENSCAGFLPLRLNIGGQARVLPNLDFVNLRTQPSTSSSAITEIAGGQSFNIVGGPQCFLGSAWWQIEFDNTRGWIAEGIADQYFLQPISDPPVTPQYVGDINELIGTTEIVHTAVSPDGTFLGVVDASGVWLYDFTDLDTPQLLYMPGQIINDIKFNNDNALLAVGTGKAPSPIENNVNAAWIWDITSTTVLSRLDQELAVRAIAFSPDSQLLAVSHPDKLFLWHISDGYEYGILSFRGGTSLTFNPDGRHLFENNADYSGYVWDTMTGHVSSQMSITVGSSIDAAGDPVFSDPVLSSDGLTIASHIGSSIIFWNGITATQQQEIFKIAEDNTQASINISGMAFSPDNHWLVTGGDRIRLWDMTFNSVTVLQAELETAQVTHNVAFSQDGSYLLGSNQINTELWDVSTHERIAILKGGNGIFGIDDVVITHSAEAVYIWDTDGDLITELHSLIARQ